MSYDVAVWVGRRPTDDVEAEGEYVRRLEEIDDEAGPPTPAMTAFLDELVTEVAHHPSSGHSPWAGPPLDDAAGDMAVLTLTPEGARVVPALCARIAAQHGLVCFDPQAGRLLETGHADQPG
jgi:hypothetical protein